MTNDELHSKANDDPQAPDRTEADLKADKRIDGWCTKDGLFKTKNPRMDALLRAYGCDRVDVDDSDPQNIVFILRHKTEDIFNIKHMIHSHPEQLFIDGIRATKYMNDNHELIREIKFNAQKNKDNKGVGK